MGLYLVFATLIIPPLATRRLEQHRLGWAWALAAIAYASGLFVSTAFDLPSGPVIVWALAAIGLVAYALLPSPAQRTRSTLQLP